MLERWRWWVFVLALAGTLVAFGCGGGRGGNSDGGSSGGDQRPDGRDLTPLEEYWGRPRDPEPGGSGEQMRAQQQRIEEQLVDCMRDRGFTYIPIEPAVPPAGDERDGPSSLPPEEFAQQYGYGMFAMDDSALGVESPPADPNQAVVDAMSEEERAAYERALHGIVDEMSGEVTAEGCAREVTSAVLGEPAAPEPPPEEFEGLLEEMDALGARISEDPRVIEATEAWVECMAEADYPGLTTVNDGLNLVQQHFVDLMGGDAASDGSGGASGDTAPGVNPPQLTADQEAEMREFEIEVAIADHGCQAGDGDYADVQYEVQVDVEQQFIEQHGDELDRYRDWLESTGPNQ